MESAPNNSEKPLEGNLEAMYQRFAANFHGATRSQFMEFRNEALRSHDATPKAFESVNGVMMETQENHDNDERQELKEKPHGLN